jgi:hypothetical protein
MVLLMQEWKLINILEEWRWKIFLGEKHRKSMGGHECTCILLFKVKNDKEKV